MKRIITVLIFIPIMIFAVSTERTLVLKIIDSPIKTDGVIDNAWNKADSAINFFQLQPYFDQQPLKKTYTKVLTKETSLLLLAQSAFQF